MELFTRFALPFEIASLILLAAIVGAVVVAKSGKEVDIGQNGQPVSSEFVRIAKAGR
jgi:hypothetical protein